MLVVGLTGGIGSGKTTVAELFAKRGVPVIDADLVARDVTRPDQPAFLAILDHFKENLLAEDGTLNRSKLRQLIFAHPKERLWLEKLLHPLIYADIKARIKKLNTAYVIIAIPLLFEVAELLPHDFINRILVVDSAESLQIARVVLRDKSEKAQIQTIINSQISREHRLAHAHDIVVNDGKLEDLIPQVEKLHELYTRLGE